MKTPETVSGERFFGEDISDEQILCCFLVSDVLFLLTLSMPNLLAVIRIFCLISLCGKVCELY